jgi:probable F420-dependent oxidoreductase
VVGDVQAHAGQPTVGAMTQTPAQPPPDRTARPVRVGVQLQPQHADYAEIRRAVVAAEEMGVDLVLNWDHFFPLYGGASRDRPGKHFECWAMLGSWAEITERVEIGALVTCNSYRNPDLLADMARTVDHASAGRLVLGIGAGWFQRDFDEYGYPFGTPGSRLAALADALPRIRARWERLHPPPTRRIPVLIGGGGERKTLRYTAEHADIWHGFGNVDTIAHKHRVLDDWCRQIGRDPAEIERSAGVRDGSVAVAEALHAAGTRLFTLGLGGPRYDLGRLRDLLAWRDERNAAAAG